LDRLNELNQKLHSLVIFRNLLDDGLIRKLMKLLPPTGSATEKISAYAEFVAALFREGENLTDCVWERISVDENVYVLKRACGQAIGPALEDSLRSELRILQELSQLPASEVILETGYEGFLPQWQTRPADFLGGYADRMQNLKQEGYGAFSKHSVFTIEGSILSPVRSPDPVRLSDLIGYWRERKAVVDNTLALLSGKPAANALLYGDAGTGKSSTVKAVVNEFAPRGLRLIEVRKDQLMRIPEVLEKLQDNPLKFILFIDDLSFHQANEEIGALKAILEGTVAAKTPNVVLYATSNRRHIVTERFSDRGDDEIHRNETIQEQVSLSQRFGLNIAFLKPDKARYLEIVRALALQYGLGDLDELDIKAEAYAIDRGGRSPRVARQFVERLMSMGV
jgi:predicted AAA+ superfamily ATPase